MHKTRNRRNGLALAIWKWTAGMAAILGMLVVLTGTAQAAVAAVIQAGAAPARMVPAEDTVDKAIWEPEAKEPTSPMPPEDQGAAAGEME